MSSKNYDVELNITYDDAHKHYIPTYRIAVPNYKYVSYTFVSGSDAWYDVFVSFDEEAEQELHYYWDSDSSGARPPVPFWNTNSHSHTLIDASGLFSKVYFRNPYRDKITFTPSNCYIDPVYTIKAAFEVQWNAIGFAANNNAWFKCSTVQKNTYKQYEWTDATVYYKKSEDSTYTSVPGTVSGIWSDVRIDTNIGFLDGYTYDVYIEATADDGTVATTPVAQFTTTDADAIAACIAPVGAFIQGETTFIWSHATEYGTLQYAYDLQYSNNNGSSWTTIASHEVTTNTTRTVTISDAGTYKWRVRTYNSNDVAGEWAEASFVNNVPANPPTNLSVDTKGRPTVTWASISQTAYQVQFLLGDSVVYDSGAVYTTQTSRFVNQYFNDERSYVVRLRVYNALGEVSDWATVGYQQPSVSDVDFEVSALEDGGASIVVIPNVIFTKYYLLRNNKLVAEITNNTYEDSYVAGLVNYSVVGVTSDDQSDIQTKGVRTLYPHATIIASNGQKILVNKRVGNAYEVQTNNQANIDTAKFIGDDHPTHYPSTMKLKSFTIYFFDDQDIAESLLGTMVFYADNFGNGGWCMVTAYDKTNGFVKNSQGIYENECSLTLEVTNYDDSLEYPL